MHAKIEAPGLWAIDRSPCGKLRIGDDSSQRRHRRLGWLEVSALQPQQKFIESRTTGLAALQTVLVLHGLGVVAQAVFAGQFLAGSDRDVFFHEYTAWVILGLSLAQIALAATLVRQGGPLWLLISSILVGLGEGLQVGSGYGRFLGVHVPLGVFIFGAVIWQTVWAFTRRTNPGMSV